MMLERDISRDQIMFFGKSEVDQTPRAAIFCADITNGSVTRMDRKLTDIHLLVGSDDGAFHIAPYRTPVVTHRYAIPKRAAGLG